MPVIRLPRTALFAALLCLLAQSAAALQLGETREQLLARHGAPGAEDRAKNLAMYFWDGWSAQVEFDGTTVAQVVYRRNWYLQDQEINALLQSNGGIARWRDASEGGKSRLWRRDDGATATYLRQRPLSMTFQVAGFVSAAPPGAAPAGGAVPTAPAAAPARAPAEPKAEPKVVFPTTPSPAIKAPTFPKLLVSAPEPALPVADPPPAEQAQSRPLPKLPTSEVRPAAGAPAESKSELAAPAPATEPKTAVAAPIRATVVAPTPVVESTSHGFAYGLGALAVVAALGGSAGFYIHRRRSSAGRMSSATVRAAAADSAPRGVLAEVEALRWDQFEMLIGEIFRRQGYTVELSAAMSAADGIDLTLRRDSETILVQCKEWKQPRISERELREFYGAMTSSGAPRGIFVTTGEFAPNAHSFAEGRSIDLMDGAAVAESITAVAKPGENLLHMSEWLDEFIAHARIFDPECPTCQGTMVIRHNRTNGAPSWTCRGYPRCPGKREPRLDLLPAAATH